VFKNTAYAKPQVQQMILRGHRLWIELKYLTANEFTPINSPTVFAAVDLQTGESEAIPFPGKLGNADLGFEVTADSLYVSVQDHLERYRMRGKNWESIAVPMTGGAQVMEFNGQLYLSTPDSLLEVAPDSGVVKILASARRNPAVNEMDSLLAENPHEFIRIDEQIGIGIENRFFVFGPTNQAWQPLPELPFKPAGETKKYSSNEGALIFTSGIFARQRLMGVWLDAAKPELLLEKHGERESTNQTLAQLLGPPRWDWPEAFNLDFPCLAAEGKSLWMLHARKVQTFFWQADEPIIFQDDRQATLLHFEPGIRRALTVPIHFEKDGQPVDPFDRKHLAFAFTSAQVPFWISASEGFIVSCHNLMGHWLIARAELESHLSTQRAAIPKAGGSQP
jgi:hypothetical protein